MAVDGRHGIRPSEQGSNSGCFLLPTLQVDRQALGALAEGCVEWSRRWPGNGRSMISLI